MEREIIGFHKDEENHWVAELNCGHNQHVRHNPPLVSRPWVISTQSREEKLGEVLNCLKCDLGMPADFKDRFISELGQT